MQWKVNRINESLQIHSKKLKGTLLSFNEEHGIHTGFNKYGRNLKLVINHDGEVLLNYPRKGTFWVINREMLKGISTKPIKIREKIMEALEKITPSRLHDHKLLFKMQLQDHREAELVTQAYTHAFAEAWLLRMQLKKRLAQIKRQKASRHVP